METKNEFTNLNPSNANNSTLINQFLYYFDAKSANSNAWTKELQVIQGFNR
jgi:hypothetical protein